MRNSMTNSVAHATKKRAMHCFLILTILSILSSTSVVGHVQVLGPVSSKPLQMSTPEGWWHPDGQSRGSVGLGSSLACRVSCLAHSAFRPTAVQWNPVIRSCDCYEYLRLDPAVDPAYPAESQFYGLRAQSPALLVNHDINGPGGGFFPSGKG